MFKKKKNKDIENSHKMEFLLIAYILRGSTSSLIKYVQTHPISEDHGRRDIVRIKYLLSKSNHVIQNIIKKMVIDFNLFEIEEESHYVFSDDDVYMYDVKDLSTKLTFFCYDGDIGHPRTIDMGVGGGSLSTDFVTHKMFLYAIKSVMYIKNNIREFEQERELRELKEKYAKAYS